MHFRIHLDGRNRRCTQNALAQAIGIFTIECLPLRHHFVEHGAQTEQIRAHIGGLALDLLWRHVMQDCRDRVGNVLYKIAHAGDAVSENLDGAIPTAHDLGRFQAVVHNVV